MVFFTRIEGLNYFAYLDLYRRGLAELERFLTRVA